MKHILGGNANSTITAIREGDPQPNAIDLRLDKILGYNDRYFVLGEDQKEHRGTYEILTTNGWWMLSTGVYEIVFENNITVGEGEAGFVLSRSTLIRNGCFIIGGLYDSGYKGVMAASLHVGGGAIILQKGVRVAQFLLFNAEMLHKYAGSYGIGSEHDVKYRR